MGTGLTVLEPGSGVSFWAKWPTASVDDSFETWPFVVVTPDDETVVRMQVNRDFYLAATTGPQMVRIAWGIIKVMTPTPQDFDSTLFLVGDRTPNPLDGSLDWVWRDELQTVIPGTSLGSGVNRFGLGPNDIQYQSRAMRKLSKFEGLLMVMAMDSAVDISNPFFSMNVRMLVKSA